MTCVWMPPCFARSKAKRRMRGSWLLRMHWRLLVLVLMLCVAMLSGCASPTSVVCSEPLTLPAEMSAQQSPGAKAYSEKVQTYLRKAALYFDETPQFTTR